MEKWEDFDHAPQREKIRSSLSKALEVRLKKKYSPSSRVDGTFRGNDITFITNESGEPITLFIGKRKKDGEISGEQYSRKIKQRSAEGEIIKSHWDNKGKIK